ncbi:MAG: oxidoreductase, partial [Gammaproteobacteria bacterium]|nr:oxidoreductase [Gammaproteobacteria bacterium]
TRCKAELLERKSVTHDILSIRFKTDSAFLFLPGQYALLELPGIGRRAYSMANLPNNDGDIEFYIKKVPSGKISPLLFDKSLDPSQAVYVDGPYGLAHVRESDRDRVCVAGGSGLAPMISIARHHLQSGCDRKMLFFFGGRKMQDLISESEFFSLIGGSGNIEFISAVSEDAGNADIRRGYIHEVLLSQLSGDLMDCDIYCAGPPVMVNALERSLYKISFPMERLYFDRFY